MRKINKVKKYILLGLLIFLILNLVSCKNNIVEEEVIENDNREEINVNKNITKKKTITKVKINDLFDDVYYKIVNGEIRGKEEILSLLEETNYKLEDIEDLDAYNVIDEKNPENYVFILFSHDDNYLEIINYYDGNKDIEVSFTNYSDDKDEKFDEYFIHIVGSEQEKVSNISEQIDFLKEAVNETAEIEKESRLKEPLNLELDLDYEFINGEIIADVETNLPDGITGTVTLTNEQINYLGQHKIEINSGKGKTESFSNKGERLEAGEYILEVSFPMTNALEDSIYKKVGKDYSNYKGDEKIEGEIGTVVKKSINVNIE